MESEPVDPTGLGLVFGTYEDGQKMIGAHSDVYFSEIDVSWPMVKYFCCLTEDANPSYWDADYARRQWGSVICPPGMLITFMIPIQWHPHRKPVYPLIAPKVPLPGDTLINSSAETEFFRPIRIGDQLNFVDEVIDLSPPKKVRVGTGHFITTVMTYRNQTGDVVAKNKNVMFRYQAEG